jgi:hypothetical protein
MRLYAVTKRRERLHQAAERMRAAIEQHRADDAGPMLAELDAYLARLTRLLGAGDI